MEDNKTTTTDMSFFDAIKNLVNQSQKTIPIEDVAKELEDFYYEAGEDYHLWDEQEKGPYPVQRVFEAIKNLVDKYKQPKN